MYHLCQRSRVYSTSLQLTLLTNQDMTHTTVTILCLCENVMEIINQISSVSVHKVFVKDTLVKLAI